MFSKMAATADLREAFEDAAFSKGVPLPKATVFVPTDAVRGERAAGGGGRGLRAAAAGGRSGIGGACRRARGTWQRGLGLPRAMDI